MSKRAILFVAGTLLLILVVSIALYALDQSQVTPETYAKAKVTPTAEKCLEENAALSVIPDRDTIELAAISYLIDVPAGTHVEVKIATYSDSKITGSDRYPAKYGSYNFEMAKQNGNWNITKFKRCT